MFQTGDILRVNSVFPFVSHYAIVFSRDGRLYAAHNSFTKGKLLIDPLDEFLRKKEFLSMVRNCKTEALTDEQIEKAIKEVQDRKYKFFYWNCEDFADYVCPNCTTKTDQRVMWGFGLFLLLIIIILFAKFLNK